MFKYWLMKPVRSSRPSCEGQCDVNESSRGRGAGARFTPTKLGDQPVKVQGVITYNFVLQQ